MEPNFGLHITVIKYMQRHIKLKADEIEILDKFYHRDFGRLIDVRKPQGRILEKLITQVLIQDE